MRVIICGGRDYTDTKKMCLFLDRVHKDLPIDVVIEGNAQGAGRIASFWARSRNIDNLKFKADWDKHGKAAGYIRNQQMLDEGKPDMVIAFPGGNGTAHMITIARKAGVRVIEVG